MEALFPPKMTINSLLGRASKSFYITQRKEIDNRGLTLSPTLVEGPNLQPVNRITDIHSQIDGPDLLVSLEIVQTDR